MNEIKSATLIVLGIALAGCAWKPQPSPYDGAASRVAPKHVIMIGLDGFAGNQVLGAEAPVLKKLMSEGAWTVHSRSILPSSSACNWHSIFTCSASEQHGYNNWNTEKPVFEPTMVGENGLYPDILYLLRRQRPDAEIGYLYQWGGMGFVADTNACSVARKLAFTNLTSAAVSYIREKKPEFLLVCYDSPDDRGHRYGWGTPEYKSRVTEIDGEIAKIMDAIKAAGMIDDTVILITADHGGLGKKHGGATLSEIERPVILWGKGVKHGYELRFPGTIYDTGATLAALLGIRPPQCWIGRPFDEAF